MSHATAAARRFMRKMPKHVEFDDIRSSAYVGLVKAARTFDPSRGNLFWTFAQPRVIGAIIDDLRYDQGRRASKRLGVFVTQWPEEEIDNPLRGVPTPEPDPLQVYLVKERRLALRAAVRGLPPRLSFVFIGRVFSGTLLKDMAQHLGCGESRTAQLYYESQKRVIDQLGRRGHELPFVNRNGTPAIQRYDPNRLPPMPDNPRPRDARYRQYKLATGAQADGSGTEMVCWLKHGPALTRGRRITLKGDDRVWTIVERYAPLLDAPPEKEWHVGGLH